MAMGKRLAKISVNCQEIRLRLDLNEGSTVVAARQYVGKSDTARVCDHFCRAVLTKIVLPLKHAACSLGMAKTPSLLFAWRSMKG